jgi:hypothetical protein
VLLLTEPPSSKTRIRGYGEIWILDPTSTDPEGPIYEPLSSPTRYMLNVTNGSDDLAFVNVWFQSGTTSYSWAVCLNDEWERTHTVIIDSGSHPDSAVEYIRLLEGDGEGNAWVRTYADGLEVFDTESCDVVATVDIDRAVSVAFL